VFSEAFKTVDADWNQTDLTVFDITQDPGISPERLANTSMLYKDDVPSLSKVLQASDPANYDILNTFSTRGRQVSIPHNHHLSLLCMCMYYFVLQHVLCVRSMSSSDHSHSCIMSSSYNLHCCIANTSMCADFHLLCFFLSCTVSVWLHL
jgi:hypothetical protein